MNLFKSTILDFVFFKILWSQSIFVIFEHCEHKCICSVKLFLRLHECFDEHDTIQREALKTFFEVNMARNAENGLTYPPPHTQEIMRENKNYRKIKEKYKLFYKDCFLLSIFAILFVLKKKNRKLENLRQYKITNVHIKNNTNYKTDMNIIYQRLETRHQTYWFKFYKI
jgi:hypothetical protein